MKKSELEAILKARKETDEGIAAKYAAAAGFSDPYQIEKDDERRALCYLAEAYAVEVCLRMLTDAAFFDEMKKIYLDGKEENAK